jgi:hypothetical protein
MYRIFFFFLFLFSVSIQSQNTEVEFTKSEIFSEEKYKTSLLFAKEDSNGDIFIVRNYYSLKSKPKGYYIEHYDKDLKLLKKTDIEVERSEIKGLYLDENQITLLEFKYSQKERKYAFVTLTSDKVVFEFKEKEIFSIDREKIKKYDHFGIRSEPEFNIHRSNNLGDIVESKNGEFIAINVFNKNKDGDKMLVTVFNRSFEKVFEQELDGLVDVKDEKNGKKLPLVYQNMVVDDSDGTVFIMAKVYKSKSMIMKNGGELNYNFVLFRFDENSKSQEILSDYENEYIRSLKLVANKTDLACLGFYTEELKNNEKDGINIKNFQISFVHGLRYDGIVRFNIDGKSGKVISHAGNPFSERFMMDKYGKEKDYSNSYLIFRDIFLNANGDAIFNAEEFEIHVSGNNIQSKNVYRDIITCRVNKEGKLMGSRNIDKIQRTWSINNIEPLSFASIFKNDKSYMFLNANEDNMSSTNYRTKFRTDNVEHFLYSISIDENGKMKYAKFPKEKTNGASVGVRFAVQINDSDLLIEAEVDEKPQLLKLSIK